VQQCGGAVVQKAVRAVRAKHCPFALALFRNLSLLLLLRPDWQSLSRSQITVSFEMVKEKWCANCGGKVRYSQPLSLRNEIAKKTDSASTCRKLLDRRCTVTTARVGAVTVD
jgi:hypothetical protein